MVRCQTHIDYIETKWKKVTNPMRMVTGHSWGADKQSQIYIYKALMRSTIDYGCIVYSLACKTSLKKIERMQYKALRIALGAFKTTPTSALLVESKEAPIHLRYEQLSLTYWVRLKSVTNPSISVLSDCWEYTKRPMDLVGILTI